MTHDQFCKMLDSYITQKKMARIYELDTYNLDKDFFTKLRNLTIKPHNFATFSHSQFVFLAETLSGTSVEPSLFPVKKQALMGLAQAREKYAKAAHRNFEVIKGGKVA
jgi:hypothetical protein